MTKLRLLHSRKTPESDTVEFDVEFLGEPLREGDTFRTYDTHHPIKWTVIGVSQTDPVVLTCEGQFGFGFEDQFTPSLVDTEAASRSAEFRYIRG